MIHYTKHTPGWVTLKETQVSSAFSNVCAFRGTGRNPPFSFRSSSSPGAAVKSWWTNYFYITIFLSHHWNLLPRGGVGSHWCYHCAEERHPLGPVGFWFCFFLSRVVVQVKCSRMRLLLYILCLWTNSIQLLEANLLEQGGGKRSNTTASWHSSWIIRCTICTYLHLFACISFTMLTSNFIFVF